MSWEVRMASLHLKGFTPPMALQTWGQLWLFVTLKISLFDLIVVLALSENCHLLCFPMYSCFTSIATEGSQALTVVQKLVEIFMTWGEQTRQRTGHVSTQGPDQIIPYCTRRSFMLMHESLVRLENILTELGATGLLPQIRLKAMVTLMVENFFSLMRKDDPIANAARIRDSTRILSQRAVENVSWPISLLHRP